MQQNNAQIQLLPLGQLRDMKPRIQINFAGDNFSFECLAKVNDTLRRDKQTIKERNLSTYSSTSLPFTVLLSKTHTHYRENDAANRDICVNSNLSIPIMLTSLVRATLS